MNILRRFLDQYGLRVRIVALITALTLILVFLIGIVMLKITEHNLLRQKAKSGVLAIQSLQSAIDTFWRDDTLLITDERDVVVLNRLATNTTRNSGLMGFQIVDTDFRVIAAPKPRLVGTVLEDKDMQAALITGKIQRSYVGEKDSFGLGLYDELVLTGPLYLDNQIVAIARFSMYLDDVNFALAATLNMLYLYAFLDMILVLLIGGLMLMHFVVRPLNSLRRSTERIIQGDLRQPIPILTKDEIGLLAKAMEKLRAGLYEKDQTVKKQMDSMESLNKSLTRIRDQLIHTDRLAYVGRVAAGVAHEIGNALGSIYGYLEVIKSCDDDRELLEDVVTRLSSEVERIDGIMQELLNFSRPQKEVTGPVNLAELITDCVEILISQRVLDDITVNILADPDTPLIYAEEGQIKQVIINFIVNAADAMNQKGIIDINIIHGKYDTLLAYAPQLDEEPSLETGETAFTDLEKRGIVFSSRIPYTAQEKIVMVNIRDHGPGIEPKNLGSIFEPFFTTKEKSKGTGLGLSICQRIVEGIGGLLRVQSHSGQGTVVTCFFLLGSDIEQNDKDA